MGSGYNTAGNLVLVLGTSNGSVKSGCARNAQRRLDGVHFGERRSGLIGKRTDRGMTIVLCLGVVLWSSVGI